jgi:hypothetical protein
MTERQDRAEAKDAGPPAEVHWDRSNMRSSACNLAGARAAPGGVALAFGASRSRAGGELEIELLHRVHLEPVAAERLRELLVKLTSEYQARYRTRE